MSKITELSTITSIDLANDVLPIVDVSDSTTKKISPNALIGIPDYSASYDISSLITTSYNIVSATARYISPDLYLVNVTVNNGDTGISFTKADNSIVRLSNTYFNGIVTAEVRGNVSILADTSPVPMLLPIYYTLNRSLSYFNYLVTKIPTEDNSVVPEDALNENNKFNCISLNMIVRAIRSNPLTA